MRIDYQAIERSTEKGLVVPLLNIVRDVTQVEIDRIKELGKSVFVRMREVPVVVEETKTNFTIIKTHGECTPANISATGEAIYVINVSPRSPHRRQTFLHELRHAEQFALGLKTGKSAKCLKADDYENYRADASERDARKHQSWAFWMKANKNKLHK